MADKPLENRTIVITRAAAQAKEFSGILNTMGARTVSVPVIEITPLESPELEESLRRINSYSWLVFTSVNGAEIFLNRLRGLIPPADLQPSICAIGPGTANRIEKTGYHVDLIPGLFQAEGLIEEFSKRVDDIPPGSSILIPRALRARDILPETLQSLGFKVNLVPVYRTDFPEQKTGELREKLLQASPDMITFTSSSTVSNFIKLARGHLDLNSFSFASIGPITTATAKRAGIHISVEPDESTLLSLAEAIAEYFSGNPVETTKEI